MTVVNNLIRQAKAEPQPDFVTINANQVGTVADHIRATMYSAPANVSLITEELLKGSVQILGVPIRVLGK